MSDANVLRWDGAPGHYEVYYLSATDPGTGTGLWIRYTMRAPLTGPGECHLWFMAMDRDGTRVGRKETFPIDCLVAEADPFKLSIAGSVLANDGMQGGFDDVSWDLRWEPRLPVAEHVHPFLQRAKIAKTVLCLPHPAVEVTGTVTFEDRTLVLDSVPGGQAHLWGSKHALRWAWLHCNDLADAEGAPAGDETFIDGVSVFVPRFGREIGPSTPVVGRFLGEDFSATSPLSVLKAPSRFGLTSWHFEAVDGKRKVIGEVDAPRDSLVGVTYFDPDGENAYCYNSEVASLRLTVLDKAPKKGWILREHLEADGRAHFEYAQRTPVADLELHVT